MPTADTRTDRHSGLNCLLAATVFLSAWLLFQVQPIVAKRILPWFGGGAGVWTAATLFFQTALLAGYLYAHLAVRFLSPRRQVRLHVVLLAAVAVILAFNRVVPGDFWKPAGSEHPVTHILAMLAACVGPPFVLLAATAPLVQVWFARANPGRSPYRLYSLSNIGSLAALLSYPFLVEPNLGVARQGVVWSILFAVFAIMCSASALRSLGAAVDLPLATSELAEPTGADAGRPRWLQWFFWLALPACASVLLLAVTHYMTQDAAAIPLLWVLPLAAYLVTFILSFDADRWYRREWWMPCLAIFSFLAVYSWYAGPQMPLYRQILAQLALLTSGGMVCHGELAAMRPAPRRLTAYYLAISTGGALGGLLAAVAAPLWLSDNYELPTSMIAAWLLAIAVLATEPRTERRPARAIGILAAMILVAVGMVVAAAAHLAKQHKVDIARQRNFYGVLHVGELTPEKTGFAHYELYNGRISHGSQFLWDVNRRVPTTYYRPGSGVGLLLAPPRPTFPRVGIVGLGAGTLAAYAEKGEEFVFYDINPLVIQFADKYFSFLEDARRRGAKITIVSGDARLALEREPPQNFDILVLDAFNGDAIPTHLLTVEAFELYLRHLKEPGGVLAVHTSNLHLNLAAVLMAAEDRFQLAARQVEHDGDATTSSRPSHWVLMTRDRDFFNQHQVGVTLQQASWGRRPVQWTDDYTNILGILE